MLYCVSTASRWQLEMEFTTEIAKTNSRKTATIHRHHRHLFLPSNTTVCTPTSIVTQDSKVRQKTLTAALKRSTKQLGPIGYRTTTQAKFYEQKKK